MNGFNDIIEEEASVFRCSEVFRFEYLPETLFYCDNQIKTIANSYRAIKDNVPLLILS